jgi:hypothetical protein
LVGYLTSFTELDPVYGASASSGITGTNITNWNTAYGWGDHGSVGYLQLAPSAAQVDSSTNSSIFVNKTGASGNLLELQKGGVSKFVVDTDGNVGIGTTAPSTKFEVNGEITSTYVHSYRQIYGDYGNFWRADGGHLYLMLTNSGDQYGTFNALRPFYVNLSSGNVTVGTDLAVGGSIDATGGLYQDGVKILNGTDTWLRTNADTGWFNSTHGGGWYMTDANVIRNYNNKELHLTNNTNEGQLKLQNNQLDTTEFWQIGAFGTDNFVIFNDATAGVYLTYGGSSWTGVSDRRLKDNIVSISENEGLSSIMQLDPVHYNWKNTETTQDIQAGFIAQDIQAIFPDLVSVGETQSITLADGTVEVIENPIGINYTGFIPYLVLGIQEQQLLIENTQTPLNALQSKYDSDTKISDILLAAEETNTKITDLENSVSQLDAGAGLGFWEYTEFSINTEKPIYSPSIYADDGVFATFTSNLLNTGLGLFTVDELGTVVAKGDTYFEAMIYGLDGVVKFADGIFAPEVTSEKYSIKNVEGSEISGSAVILAGETEVTVLTASSSENAKILATPVTFTQDKVVYVSNKVDGESFTLSISSPIGEDITVDWWIVNVVPEEIIAPDIVIVP